MIAGIILGSGYSKRMKRDKLLLKFNNKEAVENVIIAAKSSNLSRIILVYRKEEVRLIGERQEIEIIKNDKAYLGQAESVKLGVSSAGKVDGYMFLAGDQPLISRDLIDKIIKEFLHSGKGIIIPKYKEKIQMPILFSSKYKEALLSSKGEEGGYEIIDNNPEDISYIEVDSYKEVVDFDHYDDYLRFLQDNEVKEDGI